MKITNLAYLLLVSLVVSYFFLPSMVQFQFTPLSPDGYAEALLVPILCIILLLYLGRWIKNSVLVKWPVLGMLPGLVGNPSRLHDHITKFGFTFSIRGPWFTNLSYIATVDPNNLHYILSTNFANFQKGPAFREIFDALGDGLVVAESDSWKAQRKLIHSLFKTNKFQRLLENIAQQKVEKDLFPILDHFFKQGVEVDMQDILQRFTFDITCVLLFGLDPKYLSAELPHVSIATALNEIKEAWLRRHFLPQRIWKLQKWLQIGAEKKLSSAQKIIDDFLYHQIALKRDLKKSASNKLEAEKEEADYDLITSFMEQEEKESIGSFKISDNFLRDSVMSILSAGKDTTSVALAWFFWILATNPYVENKIRQEIKARFQLEEGETWKFVSFEDLNELVYLHAALCETLRLYPSVPFNHKTAVEPDILPSGHRVSRGTKILIFKYAMARMEKIWGENCAEFKPERWISERGEIIHYPSYKFVSFSAGPRTCVGKDLSFIQMKIVAAAIVWNYHLQVVEGHPVLPGNSIILRMKHGLKVKVMKRYHQ